MTFDSWWKENSKRVHSENPWREELAMEIWEAGINSIMPTEAEIKQFEKVERILLNKYVIMPEEPYIGSKDYRQAWLDFKNSICSINGWSNDK